MQSRLAMSRSSVGNLASHHHARRFEGYVELILPVGLFKFNHSESEPLRFICVWTRGRTETALAVTVLKRDAPMLFRDYFFPALTAASLALAAALTAGVIWEAVSQFIYI